MKAAAQFSADLEVDASDEATVSPMVNPEEQEMVRKKILDSQYKCFEKMNRQPPYNKTGRRWKRRPPHPPDFPFSSFNCVPPQRRTAAATGTDGCAGTTRRRPPMPLKTAPTTLWTLTPQVSIRSKSFPSKSGEQNTNNLYLVALFLSSEKATKYCGEDGQWFRHPDTNRTWSNYTLCNENTKAKLKVFHSGSIKCYLPSVYHKTHQQAG